MLSVIASLHHVSHPGFPLLLFHAPGIAFTFMEMCHLISGGLSDYFTRRSSTENVLLHTHCTAVLLARTQ